VRDGKYSKKEVDEIKGSQRLDSKERADQAKMQAQGIDTPHNAETSRGMVDITELYMMFDPLAKTWDDELDPVPFKIVFTAGGQIIQVIQNPFWHQRSPYLMGRGGTIQGRVYGTGYMEAIRELNILLNDQTNQSMDCATWSMNPIILSNPNLIVGKLAALEPGVQWLVHDVNLAVKTITPPMDVINAGSILTAQTQSWLNDFIGAPPVLQGGSAPGRAFRTATGVGTAQKNAIVPLQEMIRLSEAEVWEPMMFMFNMLDQQFANNDFMVHMNGGKTPTAIPPHMLAGNWVFKWLASTQTANQQIKGGQITELLSLLTQPGIIQLLQMNGLTVNPAPLVRRLYQEVLGFRDVDDVLIAQAMGMSPPGAAQGSAPSLNGGAPAPGTEPGVDPALADNPDFQATRQMADQISGMMGEQVGG
jgi:hypothetical protein